jgi:hypothetical protein
VRQWYDGRRPGLGSEFGVEFDTTVTRIVENPFAFQLVRGDKRRAVLTRFPYAIYFQVTSTEIVLLAVHGRQDPRRWQTRS